MCGVSTMRRTAGTGEPRVDTCTPFAVARVRPAGFRLSAAAFPPLCRDLPGFQYLIYVSYRFHFVMRLCGSFLPVSGLTVDRDEGNRKLSASYLITDHNAVAY